MKLKSTFRIFLSKTIILSSLICFSYCNRNETYHEKIMTVEQMEMANPANFLIGDGKYGENIWGTKLYINGKITNNATVANYKDVIVEVIFYSKTDTELDRKQYTVYDVFPAHSSKDFNLRFSKPSAACEKLSWNVIGATAN